MPECLTNGDNGLINGELVSLTSVTRLERYFYSYTGEALVQQSYGHSPGYEPFITTKIHVMRERGIKAKEFAEDLVGNVWQFDGDIVDFLLMHHDRLELRTRCGDCDTYVVREHS